MSKLTEIDGKPVIDARRGTMLHITKQDIAKGDRKRPDKCAAALAILREMHAIEARVHLSRIYIRTNKGNWQRYVAPRSLRSEVIAYDRGGQFEVGTHYLCAPQPTAKLGAGRVHKYKDTRKGAHGKGKKRRQLPHITRNVRTGPAV